MNNTQIAVLSGSVLIIVLLYFANTKLPDNSGKMDATEVAPVNGLDVNTFVERATVALEADQKENFVQLKSELSTATDKTVVYEKLVYFWDQLRQPIVAAYFMEQIAINSNKEMDWKKAGDRYYAATRFVTGEEKPMLFSRALECFEKTLELNPDNIDAKINLASCYVEGSAQPMKGIGMLRDIEKIDSNNINLQMSFAFFSEKSGQWDKAISRFEKILKIQPSFIEAYLHLADAYEQKGEKQKVIESLEKYITLVDDVAIKSEVQEYINKLKN